MKGLPLSIPADIHRSLTSSSLDYTLSDGTVKGLKSCPAVYRFLPNCSWWRQRWGMSWMNTSPPDRSLSRRRMSSPENWSSSECRTHDTAARCHCNVCVCVQKTKSLMIICRFSISLSPLKWHTFVWTLADISWLRILFLLRKKTRLWTDCTLTARRISGSCSLSYHQRGQWVRFYTEDTGNARV